MKIGIVGLGLIGGSLAKAIKSKTDHVVYGFDLDEVTQNSALSQTVIQGGFWEEKLESFALIIVTLYPKDAIKFIDKYSNKFNKNTIVIDCCGVKENICKQAFALGKQYGFTFIGGHPMAGREFSGYDFSSANLFVGAPMILTPDLTASNNDEKQVKELELLESLFIQIGFKDIIITDSVNHDQRIGFTSQLAHVVSNAYVKSPTALAHQGFSAGSYKDLTRVAKLNETMWAELFLENRKNLVGEIKGIIESLLKYQQALEEENRPQLEQLLKDGRLRKESVG